MHRSTHILLYFLVSLAVLGQAVAENKQSIATAEFLSVLAKNVATVLSPTLLGELRDGRPNRTAVNATNIQSISTTFTTPKDSETTEEPLKSSNLEADTVRSAQTQSEVGSGNHGFPFNYDDNYRYNYPGINSQGLQRPDFSSGLSFGHPGHYNSELYRSYPSQITPDRNPRPDENALQQGEPAGGISAVENVGNGQPGQTFDSLDPSSTNFGRFRNLERYPFNNQFSSGISNFQNLPFSSERLQAGRLNPYNVNLPGNSNLPGNPNFQNSIGNNYPRNNFQSFVDHFQQRQHAHDSNSFDFLPSQRFQNPFDNYPRSLQRGPNLLGFYNPRYVPGLRDFDSLATPSPKIDANKNEQALSSELSTKAEKLDVVSKKNSSDTTVTTENPQVLNIGGQIRFGNLFVPALEDYSDVRFQPDGFRQYLFTPSKDNANNNDKNDNNNNKNKKTVNNNNNNSNNNSTNGNVNDV